jgi:signal transduction histidine kinase
MLGLPERIEVGPYYVVSEAFANAAKHAQASAMSLNVDARDRVLRVTVGGDYDRACGVSSWHA